jgi:Ni2+-binding GTPase involved in maturation of urease and hydrogenase
MAQHPLTVDPSTPGNELAELMETARIHHLPLLDGDRLVGLWLASESGPLVLVGPERVEEMDADDDAAAAMRALFAGADAVIARTDGHVVGLLTQADVMKLVQNALSRGLGERENAPVTIRLVGPAGAGKITLLMRTIPLLRTCDVGVVGGEALAARPAPADHIEGAPLVVEPHSERDDALARAIRGLGDVQVAFVEGRDELPSTAMRPACDYMVVVVPADAVGTVSAELLRVAEAVVITKLDVAPEGFDLALQRDRLRREAPHLEVFGVAAATDNRGLAAWRRWLRGRVLPRRH